MESNICKGDKTHFKHFVRMTMQNEMSWKTLATLLKDLAPTLKETREIISILLKELEAMHSTLQKKDERYQKENNDFEETEQKAPENNTITLENETIADDIINDDYIVEAETIRE